MMPFTMIKVVGGTQHEVGRLIFDLEHLPFSAARKMYIKWTFKVFFWDAPKLIEIHCPHCGGITGYKYE